MALAITSFTPITGPVTGGTSVTITGTGLDIVAENGAVLIGTKEARIDTNATNSATSLTVITPPGAAAAAVKINAFDGTTAAAVSSTSFTYSAVASPVLSSTSNAKWQLQVDLSEAQDGSAFTNVRGMQSFTPATDQTTQDASTFDDVQNGVSWKSTVVTQLGWSLASDVLREMAPGFVEDPAQKALRVAAVAAGAAGVALVRYFDKNGTDEAYEGRGTVQWSEKGGDLTQLSIATVTITGIGPLTSITNPAI